MIETIKSVLFGAFVGGILCIGVYVLAMISYALLTLVGF